MAKIKVQDLCEKKKLLKQL
ncbi:unnamed protein product [Gulo gulo]|uniref:Uncharacterized protein n=1 Tax=Gulo gulo TaxID=48420 RepID=A0A9X9Q2N3_GULGU|nr:unnamed protein product [Gulo gulo]